MPEFPTFPPVFWAAQSPDQTAVLWERGNSAFLLNLPREMSWQMFSQLVCQSADFLQAKFSLKNQTVAFCGESRFLGVLAYLSVIACGGRILMLNAAMPAEQRNGILADLNIRILLTDQDFANFSPDFTACNAFLPEWNLKNPATLTLTSGSSGKPKAVVHNASAHLLNAQGVCELMQFGAENCWLLSLPLFHVSGQGIVWRWLLSGATLGIYEDKADFYSLLADCSHASLVPTQLQRYLAQNPKAGQKILLGGAYLPPELIKHAQDAGLSTFAGYGMTELGSTICAVENETDNVGKPLLGRVVKIENEQIWVKSECLALGYWQNEQIVPIADEQGWFATKDKGEWQNGNLVVKGRLDNMFISGGENIQPEQVESVLYCSGLLETVFIVPKNDAEFGQRPVAFVQPYSEQAVEMLQNFAKQQLEKFKQPIAYLPLAEFIANTQGIKISRKALQQHLQTIAI